MKFVMRIAATIMVGAIVAMVPGTASAAEAPQTQAEITTYVSDDILWIETSVAGPEIEDLKVKILTPRSDDGKRSVFQVCEFNYSGEGSYLCGIDVGEGSIAQDHEGRWVGKAVVDREVSTKQSFTI